MGRERQGFNRISGIKDPSLIVIATEGRETEQQYFEAVRLKCVSIGSRLKVEVIPTHEHDRDPSHSSPKYVLDQLSSYKKKYGLNTHDELCMAIDRDKQSWTEAELSWVAAECSRKQFLLALSNPCFEVWLLLHLVDVDDYNNDKKARLLENLRDGRHAYIKHELARVLSKAVSSNIDLDDYWDNTSLAVSRAEAMDTAPTERWPNNLGSRVYLLMKKIMESLDSTN